MAAIDDLITQIEDKALRERLQIEANRIVGEKKFGLVFEEHLPELVPIYSANVRRHRKVALRNGSLTEMWHVLSVQKGEAQCLSINDGKNRVVPVDDLVVVENFGEPIFPTLVPIDRVQNGPNEAPWHTLIEADNYHALQLLEYLYAGRVDCIYIDPPYNTGARDWKYNNNYVDKNDRWRHSKWLAMMRRRLILAMRLLQETGMMIVTIDDHEAHRLRCLIEDYLPSSEILGVIPIRNNPSGRATVRGFSVSHEYAFFVAKSEKAKIRRVARSEEQMRRFSYVDENGPFEWRNFRKDGGEVTYRTERPKQFYPIFVNKNKGIRIPALEWNEVEREWEVQESPVEGEIVLWPIDADGNERVWSLSHKSARNNLNEMQVRFSEDIPSIYRKNRPNEGGILPRTWWDRKKYSAREYGSTAIKNTFGLEKKFPFAKSPYAVADCLMVGGGAREDALILDFFAGSGTTLHAVNYLNAIFGGSRRCIMVTNNEVSESDSKTLVEQGYRGGQDEWEKHGICRSITWPRSKFTILGQRDDGSALDGDYITGKRIEKKKPRTFRQIAFTSTDVLNTVAKRKQLVALIEGIPQSAVKRGSTFVVSNTHPASILFDDAQANEWVKALIGQEHITDFYVVTSRKPTFDELKSRINDLLGPVIVANEEKRPMREGFEANLEYFRLDFLDKDHVVLGRQFREILPLLWLRAGAIGPRPELPRELTIPAMVIPAQNPFAVLVEEARFADFVAKVRGRDDLTHAFLVTDSDESFREMAQQLNVPDVLQLYRDYLENFVINRCE